MITTMFGLNIEPFLNDLDIYSDEYERDQELYYPCIFNVDHECT